MLEQFSLILWEKRNNPRLPWKLKMRENHAFMHCRKKNRKIARCKRYQRCENQSVAANFSINGLQMINTAPQVFSRCSLDVSTSNHQRFFIGKPIIIHAEHVVHSAWILF